MKIENIIINKLYEEDIDIEKKKINTLKTI